MGLNNIRAEVVRRLKEGFIQHDTDRSGEIDVKNLLLTGEISVEEVIELIQNTKGTQYQSSPHHYVPSVDVHIFRPKEWYIKFYFIDPDVIFISVHK